MKYNKILIAILIFSANSSLVFASKSIDNRVRPAVTCDIWNHPDNKKGTHQIMCNKNLMLTEKVYFNYFANIFAYEHVFCMNKKRNRFRIEPKFEFHRGLKTWEEPRTKINYYGTDFYQFDIKEMSSSEVDIFRAIVIEWQKDFQECVNSIDTSSLTKEELKNIEQSYKQIKKLRKSLK